MAKKEYGKGKFVLHSILCVILVFLLTVLLIVSLISYRLVRGNSLMDTASAVPVDQVTVPLDTGEEVTLAKRILDRYLTGSTITEEQMATILREGDFQKTLRSDVWTYLTYLRSGMQTECPDVTPQQFVHAIDRNADLIERTAGVTFTGAEKQIIIQRLEPDVSALNSVLKTVFTQNPGKLLLRIVPSMICWIALSVLLLLLLIRLIVVQVRSHRHVGSAFRTFAVTAFIPAVLVLIASAAAPLVLSHVVSAWTKEPAAVLRIEPLIVSAIGSLGCIVLFGFGSIWNLIAEKVTAGKTSSAETPEYAYASEGTPIPGEPVPEPVYAAPAPGPEPVAPAPPAEPTVPDPGAPAVPRKFCRFCGQTLVNPNALFCYKCGNKQADVDSLDADGSEGS